MLQGFREAVGAGVHRSGQRAPEWRYNSFGSRKQRAANVVAFRGVS